MPKRMLDTQSNSLNLEKNMITERTNFKTMVNNSSDN